MSAVVEENLLVIQLSFNCFPFCFYYYYSNFIVFSYQRRRSRRRLIRMSSIYYWENRKTIGRYPPSPRTHPQNQPDALESSQIAKRHAQGLHPHAN